VTETAQNIKSMSLPEKWTTTKLKDISEKITKGSTPTSYGYSYKTEGIKFIKAENIDENSNVFSTTNFIDEETNEFLKRSILHENDLLFSIAGTIGRIALIKKADLPGNTNQALAIIRTLPGVISHKYLLYYLKSDAIQKKALKKIVGVGRANLSLKNVGEFEVPIAPENEQKRIVAEIEKQFSRLDEAVDNLKRVKANLKRYKASVLKAAVEGKLTEEWRKVHPDIEPADKLLDRILAERRNKWEEAELAKMRTAGKKPKDDKWKKKYKEPTGPTIENLPSLPDNWIWVSMEQIAERITKGSSPKWQGFEYVNKGIPFVRSQNVLWGQLAVSEVAHLQQAFNKKQARSVLKDGDVLLNIVGASIGRAAIATPLVEGGNVNQAVAVIRLLQKNKYNSFLVNYLISDFSQKMISKGVVDVARGNFSLTDIANLPVPLPPEKEQQIIVDEIEKCLSVAEGIEFNVEQNILRTEHLRQSILKEAFSGKLVPQDSNDEPVSILIEEIKQELVNKGTSKVKTKRRKTPKRGKKVKSSKIKRKLMDILSEYPDGIRPELLLSEANYSIDEIDDFYARLGKISDQIDQIKPTGKQALKWPFEAEVTLRLRSK
jgi:type I restriction enzyme S subunit